MRAAQLLPQLGQQQFQTQMQGGVGQEAYNQRPFDTALQEHQFSNQQPLMMAQAYGNLMAPLFGLQQDQEQVGGWGSAIADIARGFTGGSTTNINTGTVTP